MNIQKSLFGKLADGREVYAYTLTNKNGMSAKIISYGGAIVELRVPDKNGCMTDVVGGYDCLDYYVGADGYQGALIGRWGNRIGQGKFTLEGKEYTVALNDNGINHLHGGKVGYDSLVWDVTEKDGEEPAIELHLLSADGDEGYPGNLDLTVTYTLTNENGLVLRYVATTDQTTVLNLTNHTYFNLRGYAYGSVMPLELWVDADTYLPTDAGMIPTGEIRSVEGTPFDFRVAKTMGQDFHADDLDLKLAGGYDHCFNFVGGETKEPVKRAELYDPESGRAMAVYTNQPCIQVYSGNFLKPDAYPFKGGFVKQAQALMCLETQKMPDSVNHENFTDCTLKAGEIYDYTTEYRFFVR